MFRVFITPIFTIELTIDLELEQKHHRSEMLRGVVRISCVFEKEIRHEKPGCSKNA